MSNKEIARHNWKRAETILGEARGLAAKGAWNLVVRRCQEAVELALKASLLWAAIEVPRVHDVGPALRRHKAQFPQPFQENIDRLASLSRKLRREREVSLYGDEESGVPPEELYNKEDAQEALEAAETVLVEVSTLLKG